MESYPLTLLDILVYITKLLGILFIINPDLYEKWCLEFGIRQRINTTGTSSDEPSSRWVLYSLRLRQLSVITLRANNTRCGQYAPAGKPIIEATPLCRNLCLQHPVAIIHSVAQTRTAEREREGGGETKRRIGKRGSLQSSRQGYESSLQQRK